MSTARHLMMIGARVLRLNQNLTRLPSPPSAMTVMRRALDNPVEALEVLLEGILSMGATGAEFPDTRLDPLFQEKEEENRSSGRRGKWRDLHPSQSAGSLPGGHRRAETGRPKGSMFGEGGSYLASRGHASIAGGRTGSPLGSHPTAHLIRRKAEQSFAISPPGSTVEHRQARRPTIMEQPVKETRNRDTRSAVFSGDYDGGTEAMQSATRLERDGACVTGSDALESPYPDRLHARGQVGERGSPPSAWHRPGVGEATRRMNYIEMESRVDLTPPSSPSEPDDGIAAPSFQGMRMVREPSRLTSLLSAHTPVVNDAEIPLFLGQSHKAEPSIVRIPERAGGPLAEMTAPLRGRPDTLPAREMDIDQILEKLADSIEFAFMRTYGKSGR